MNRVSRMIHVSWLMAHGQERDHIGILHCMGYHTGILPAPRPPICTSGPSLESIGRRTRVTTLPDPSGACSYLLGLLFPYLVWLGGCGVSATFPAPARPGHGQVSKWKRLVNFRNRNLLGGGGLGIGRLKAPLPSAQQTKNSAYS